MKLTGLGTVAAAIAATALAIPTLRAADQTLSDYKIGKSVLGEKVSKKDLEGKVVVIEYWGTR